MNNYESISYYEKLHDIFERVSPQTMPAEIDSLANYLKLGTKWKKGCNIEIGDVLEILEEMKLAFSEALIRSKRSILLVQNERGYEVNIYPILHFLRDNPGLSGELDNLKKRMVDLLNEKNIEAFQKHYQFVDDLSNVL